MKARLAALLPLLAVSACASMQPQGSLLAPEMGRDAPRLVPVMADFVAAQVPRATVAVEPPDGAAGRAVSEAFERALIERGLTLAGRQDKQAERVRYWLAPVDNVELVCVIVGQRAEGSQVFVHGQGGDLQAVGPLVVRYFGESQR